MVSNSSGCYDKEDESMSSGIALHSDMSSWLSGRDFDGGLEKILEHYFVRARHF